MPRVIGIDPGTVTLDVCGLDDGRVFLDRSWPAPEVLANPSELLDALAAAAPIDLIAGPSGYGLPLVHASGLTDEDLKLAYLPDEQQPGGISGLRRLARALARLPSPVVLTPGVVHMESVPSHRKINRVDMGTADKVCAAALAIHEQAARRGCTEREASFILLELGGAFTAAIGVCDGAIVDGIGGTSGPIGIRAAGALDGEVAFLAGTITKRHLFSGGAAAVAGAPTIAAESLRAVTGERGRLAWEAYVEGVVKAAASLAVSVPRPHEVVLSGRLARTEDIRDEVARRIEGVLPNVPVHTLTGFAAVSKQAAQGAALLADGLAGGRFAPIVAALGLREARGSVLDHLYIITPAEARARLGLDVLA